MAVFASCARRHFKRIRSGAARHAISAVSARVVGVQVTAVCSGVEMLTGTRAGQLVKWRCDSGSVVHYVSRDDEAGARWTAHDAAVSVLDVFVSRRWLVSGSADSTLRVWDLNSNLLLQTLAGHNDQVTHTHTHTHARSSLDYIFHIASSCSSN